MIRRAVWMAVASLWVGTVFAGTESWRAEGLETFLEGTLENVTVGPRGTMSLAARSRTAWGPEPGVVWSATAGTDGVVVGLSDPARVVGVGPGGAREWFRGEADQWVTAVAGLPDGRILAGVSPAGRVLVLDDGAVVEEHVLGGGYVWALAVDDTGAWWAGTGAPGRILRHRPPEEWESVHETGDDPVRSLVALPGGGVVAGTGRHGRVLRIRSDGRPFVLVEVDEDEVVALALDRGDVLALAAREGAAPRTPAAQGSGDDDGAAGEDASASGGDEGGASAGTSVAVTPRPGGATVRVSAPAGPGGGTLYRITADGDVEPIWESPKEPPYALGVGPGGEVLVGLGGSGRVVRVLADGETAHAFRLPSENVTSFVAAAGGGWWIGASGDARVVRVGSGPADDGTFVSNPIDASWIADWGRVRAAVRGSGRDAIAIEVRVGNVSDPDDTWSPWTAVTLDERGGGSAAVPPARWAQVRVRLSRAGGRDGAEPAASSLEWSYDPRNRAPRIVALDVEPPGVAWSRRNGGAPDRTRPLVADDPVARTVADEVGRRPRPAPIRKSYEPGVRTVRWTAVDPDGDGLRFDLELALEGSSSWIPIATGLEDEFHGWDARGVPDGTYRVRLTADDGVERSPGTRRVARRVSPPFRVDNTPPSVRADPTPSGWSVVAVDPGGRLAALERADGVDDWVRVDPEDGVVDGERERFLVLVADPSSNPRVRVRVTDQAGNVREATLERDDRRD